ncbi:Chitinase [Minicystis rosea]|nr:Chitinase [Minicystis rosea]
MMLLASPPDLGPAPPEAAVCAIAPGDDDRTPLDLGAPTSTSSSSSSTSTGGIAIGATTYAPYFYTWGWGNSAYPFTGLADLRRKTGIPGVTLAFVLAQGGCAATAEIQEHLPDVKAFRSTGGKLKASFGGASGTYLESACPDAEALKEAIGTFIERTGITDLDFDVEQASAMTSSINRKRAEALRQLQSQKAITVSFTLTSTPPAQSAPGGITATGIEVLRTSVQAGVKLTHVNLMTMNYAAADLHARSPSDLAMLTLTDARAQLQALIPGLAEAQAWSMLGVTPMIGQNGGSGAVFTLADAQALATFARQRHLGLVSFWAINRDQPGSGSLAIYSRAQSSAFAFHEILKTVAP